MFGSYNKFDARVHVDAHIVLVVDFLTSLLASIVVFSTLGHIKAMPGFAPGWYFKVTSYQ